MKNFKEQKSWTSSQTIIRHSPSKLKKSLGLRVRMDTEQKGLVSFLPVGIIVNIQFSEPIRFGREKCILLLKCIYPRD